MKLGTRSSQDAGLCRLARACPHRKILRLRHRTLTWWPRGNTQCDLHQPSHPVSHEICRPDSRRKYFTKSWPHTRLRVCVYGLSRNTAAPENRPLKQENCAGCFAFLLVELSPISSSSSESSAWLTSGRPLRRGCELQPCMSRFLSSVQL